MTPSRPPRADAATAGMYLVGTIAGCGLVGLGIGSLVGLAAPLGLLGVFVGIAAGLALVYARYKRI